MIDFSCKRDILIANPDGTFSPMDEPFFQAKEIAPNTWQILSSGDFSYFLVGDNEGISIDTGYGAGNIREFLQTLTDKPVRNTINTHHHFDHTAGNSYFEKSYMHPEAFDYATIPYASFEGIDFPRDYEKVAVYDGDTYELGNRKLELFWIPDHTPDGIAILDYKERILFIGDELMPMGKILKVPVATFFGYMEKLLAHSNDYDRIFSGGGELPKEMIQNYYNCAKAILEGNHGEPAKPRIGGPREMPPGPNGEIVYDRIAPRKGDGGAGKDTPPGRLHCYESDGARIIFDMDLL
ncbi:MAG: MBL fold metallo-hydrolase [Lachnospiraceae bacterium]|jgi:glyoxylase-like metal-dependent hydrolase (beta-lactamase superfamily II)